MTREEQPQLRKEHAQERLYRALQNMVRAANVDEIDPLVMFVCIEQAKAALELAERER